MPAKLNQRGFDHARTLVEAGRFVFDERDDWSEHQPTAAQENEFIEAHGWGAYGEWHLGIDPDASPETKAHWKFPYGDFDKVHRCGLLAAESRAGQRKYADIERAAAHLHGMIEGARTAKPRS
ncbi:MAG TPA: hypothetical protein VGQ42_01695 [Candidatus Dormibacteraeota bacterium]|jgi:hypothetical protein|nr:hypothetical protein [Candidatus Dormibacteraeota bacterium]